MIELLGTHYAYALMFVLLGIGLYMTIASENLVKKLIGVNLFQTAIFLFFVAVAYVEGGGSPVVPADSSVEAGSSELLLASPLPHVIVLTAIVVGIALTAVGLALIVRIHSEYGTLREDTLREVRADE
ncbi:cation:proton antiporter subunit C [Natrialbaceae archaeon A-CW3]